MKSYAAVLVKAQKGYPLEKYQSIIDAMSALDFIETYEVSEIDQIRIIETQLFNLENG